MQAWLKGWKVGAEEGMEKANHDLPFVLYVEHKLNVRVLLVSILFREWHI